jgi:hypothetical protein
VATAPAHPPSALHKWMECGSPGWAGWRSETGTDGRSLSDYCEGAGAHIACGCLALLPSISFALPSITAPWRRPRQPGPGQSPAAASSAWLVSFGGARVLGWGVRERLKKTPIAAAAAAAALSLATRILRVCFPALASRVPERRPSPAHPETRLRWERASLCCASPTQRRNCGCVCRACGRQDAEKTLTLPHQPLSFPFPSSGRLRPADRLRH